MQAHTAHKRCCSTFTGNCWVSKSNVWVAEAPLGGFSYCRLRLKCDGTRAEIRFLLSAKRTIPLKSAGASFQSTTGSRDLRINGSNAGYTKFRGSVKGTGHPLHSPVSPSLPLQCVTVCHHISTGLYNNKEEEKSVRERMRTQNPTSTSTEH